MTKSPTPDTMALLRRSADTIKRLEEELQQARSGQHEPIAIIGIGCRFPGGSDTPEKLWSLLLEGRDAVIEVPKERWDLDKVYDPDPDAPGKAYARCGGFLDQVDSFDAAFFGITPREAVSLDPQQRLLLEVTWEALEHAGIPASAIAGSHTGVYVGLTASDYATINVMQHHHKTADAYAASGASHSIAAGRLSYFLGLHGPNIAVDTACSASIVSVHSAVRALRSREADLALAGGVTLTLSEYGSILTSRARMMSFKGRCQTFDENADGYVRGEGCAMIALKRQSDALRDGDRILAYIRGSALNQDGRSTGMTAPNGQAQVKVLKAALRDAQLSPDDISYIEAHGTGTPLGDPIEMKALGEVFGKRSKDTPLHVASIKTNIGHTEGAAGIAGIVKTVMALKNKQIPAHLHFNTPNPHIPWDNLPVVIPQKTLDWPTQADKPRRAGTSSFGFSGTNGHVILEEAVEDQSAPDAVSPAGPVLVPLSAHTETALNDVAANLAGFLRAQPQAGLHAAAAELALGRSHLVSRIAFVASDRDDALQKLDAIADGQRPAGVAFGSVPGGEPPELAFLFTGQGSQFPDMGRQLYESEPIFRAALDRCDALLAETLEHSLLSVIFAPADSDKAALLNDTAYAQPALFALEWALSELWRSWGITPSAAIGHSVGEYTAACVAGVFSLQDGLTLIAERGRLMSSLPAGGGMAAVFTPEADARTALVGHEAHCAIAAVNGPNNTVISGRLDVVDQILSDLENRGLASQKLVVSHAFHSPLMDPILDQLESTAARIEYKAPQIALISNLTGEVADSTTYCAQYWRRHARQAVRFSDAIAALHGNGFSEIIELGPSATLSGMAQQCPDAERANWFASLRKGTNDQTHILETASRLYAGGQTLNWAALFPENVQPVKRAALPTYPFQRVRYWNETSSLPLVGASSSGHPFLGDAIPGAVQTFFGTVSLETAPWLGDHRLYGTAPFPAAGMLDLALTALQSLEGHADTSLSDVEILNAMMLPEDGGLNLQIVVSTDKSGTGKLDLYSCSVEGGEPGDWQLNLTAKVNGSSGSAQSATVPPMPATAQARDVDAFYDEFEEIGVSYGPAFRPITQMHHTEDEVWGSLELPGDLSLRGFLLHPALLDGCAQMVGCTITDGAVHMPISVDAVEVFGPLPALISCHVAEKATGDPELKRCDFSIFDTDGTLLARIVGLVYRKISKQALMRAVSRQGAKDWFYDLTWRSVPVAETDRTDPAGSWLILNDQSGLGDRLADTLRDRGATVCVLPQTNEFETKVAEVLESGEQPRNVVCLWPLDFGEAPDLSSLEDTHQRVLLPSLTLVQSAIGQSLRLWFVTRGAQSVSGEMPNLAIAPLNAFAGVVASELPEIDCVRIDLDSSPNAHEDALLFQSLWTPDSEDQIAFRGEARLAARLKQGHFAPAAETAPVLLNVHTRGSLDALTFDPISRSQPQPDEVEVRVHATGVNFRDVLNTLGMYPGDPGPLGSECAGVISAVGDNVTGFAVGDEVVAMTDRSFATYVNVSQDLVVRKPQHLTMAQAAAIPVTHLTADYALRILGKVKKGDKVLIHAVTGGVGSAAAEIARDLGARVFGTAGNPEKRVLALSQGVEYVADSRSLSFVEDIRQATGGEGVDFVLNSLANEFIPASLSLLKPGGCFVEIGKTDDWPADRIEREFPGIDYHQLYLGEVTAADSKLVCAMLERLFDKIGTGALPVPALRAWPLEQAQDAFRFMAQGLHTGKIVLTQTRPSHIDKDASYLVTGGLRGIGLRTAQWLAEAGVSTLVLLGRSAADSETLDLLERWRDQGTTVHVRSVDVTDQDALSSLISEIQNKMPALRGVIHCAGVLDDAVLADQNPDRLARVMAPKVRGGYLLDKLTRHLTLDFFVTYASGAGLLGSPGQANYAAANGFLDSLAHARQAQGLPALSVDWGSWSEIGMASRVDDTHQRRWADMGLSMIDPDAGVHMLEQAIFGSTSAQVALLPITREKLPQEVGPLLRDLVSARASQRPAAETEVNLREVLSNTPEDQHQELVGNWLNETVIRVLALDEHTGSDRNRSLMDFGMDSLMAMELQNRIASGLDIKIASTELLKGPTLNQLVTMAMSELAGAKDEVLGDDWEEIDI